MAVCMSMDEEAIRNETVRFKSPMECWGCTNSPRYHADRFHTYRNCPNERDPYVDERPKQSVQEYSQHPSMKGGKGGDQDIQEQHGRTSSMAVRSIFAERRIQIN